MKELLKRRLTFLLSLTMCVSMIQLPAATVYAEDDFISDDFYEAAQEMNQEADINADITADVNADTYADANADGDMEAGAETENVNPAEAEDENDFLMEEIPMNDTEKIEFDTSWSLMEENAAEGENLLFIDEDEIAAYRFIPEQSGTYCFYTASDKDTMGILLDQDNNLLMRDDNSGDGDNFSITADLQEGQLYYIGVSFGDMTESGTVSLYIKRMRFESLLAENLYMSCNLREDGIEIEKIYGTFPEVLTIPSTIDGYPVVRLSAVEYDYSVHNVTEVILPDTLKELGGNVLREFWYLKKFNIPSSLEIIEEDALCYCYPDSIVGSSSNKKYYVENHILYGDFGETVIKADNGIVNAVIADGVLTIDKSAFAFNKGVISVTFPDSLRVIGKSAFYSCSHLKSVTFQEGLQEIQDSAFESNYDVRFNDLPDSVCSIGRHAFWACSSNNNYHIPLSLNVMGDEAFNNGAFYGASASGEFFAADNILYGNYGKEILCVGNIGRDVTIAEGVEVIPEYAFRYEEVEHVTLPSTLRTIEYGAFYYCRELTAIDIPDSVTEIYSDAFLGCKKATRIHIPTSIISCSEYAFRDISGVQTITGGNPANGYHVVDNVFYIMNDNIKKVIIAGKDVTSFAVPEGITVIEENGFDGCNKLTAVTLPSTLTSIKNETFRGCSSLAQITIPDSVEEIEYSAFCGCSSLTQITIPNSVKAIGYEAFMGCSSLNNVVLSSNLTALGSSVLANCTSLTSIVIPDQITRIGGECFSNCTSLTTVQLPASLEYISSTAFDGCISLRSITGGPSDESVGMKDGILYTDNGSTVNWAAPWITVAELKDGVTKIEANAFQNCINLREITLPDSVAEIGYKAFQNCCSLEKIEIPLNVTCIAGYTFKDCTSLVEVILPEGLENINYCAFKNCSSLTVINFPQSLRTIQDAAFESCGLTDVSLPSGITELSPAAFSECANLTTLTGTAQNGCFRCYNNCLYVDNILGFVGKNESSVSLLSGIDRIGDHAFSNCNKLIQYTVPEQIAFIEPGAFNNCINLIEITLPSNFRMWEDIFRGCYSLQNIYTSSADGRYVSQNGVLYENISEKYLIWYPAGKTNETFTIGSEVTGLAYHSFYNCSNLKKVYFEGDAPSFSSYATEGSTFTGYYPKDNVTWDVAVIMKKTEGITWVPYTPGQIVPDKTSITSIKSAATGIALSWKECEGADGYYIYRSIYGENKYSRIKTIKNGATTSTTDTKVESGVTYIYKIKAYNESGSSAYSATKYTRYMAAPANVKAENVLTGIKVTWEPVEGVTGYTVYRRGPGENVFKSIKTFSTPNTLSYTNTGIGEAYGNAYEYVVQAYYTTSSGKTTYTSALPNTGTRMIRIRSVEAPTLKNLSTGVKISWNLVDGADGYKVYRKADGEADYKLVYTTTKPTTVSYTNTSAKNGIRYSYKVAAYVNDGSKVYLGRLSNEKTIVRLDQMVMTSVAAPSAGKLTAIWEANPAGVPYQIEYSTSSTFSSYTRKTFGKSATTTTLTGLTSGKTYYVRIRSYFKEADGTTYYSAWSTAKSIKVK